MSILLHVFNLELTNPWWFLLVLLAAPVAYWSYRAAGRVRYSSLAALPRGGATWRSEIAWLPDALLGLAVVALAFAMVGPRIPDRNSRIRHEGIAIAMVIDTSGSMAALDLSEGEREQTRLDAVKAVFRRFINGGDGLRGRADDAVGLVSFARYADTRAPLTLDHGTLLTAVDQLALATEPGEDGTAIADGLALAIERLRESPAKSRVAIVLSDGVDNASQQAPAQVADEAKAAGVKVYTIGAGTDGMAPVRVDDPWTGQSVLRAMPVEIDEELLKDLAARTGGAYFRATDAAGLAKVYGEIDRLERTALSGNQYHRYRELYALFVWIGLGLVMVAFVLRGTLLRRLP